MPIKDIDDTSAPLIEHLAELRDRLIRSVLAFFAAMIAAFSFWNPVYDFLTRPVCAALAERGQECELIFIKLQEGFMVAVQISLLGGLAISFPYISYQLWRFVAPGLYRKEKLAFLPFVVASPALFFIGAAFAYYVVMPIGFSFFLGFQQGPVPAEGAVESAAPAALAFQGSAEAYLSLTIKFIVAFGLCFQLPVLLTLMGMAEIISAQSLASTRKYAVVVILVLAAIATPPDVVSQLIMFGAVYPLYEVSILLVRWIEKRREARLRAEGYYDTPAEPAANVPAEQPGPAQ
jgi:sec-independent protein translocase protein TatC